MRPPSYYASIVKSNNTTGGGYGSGSYSTASDYSTLRTSSQQLRSSLSSPSSSNYVSRSHLPFVPQSTLVAHCFTGVNSSTRPYGSSSAHSSTPSYRTSRGTSPSSYASLSSYTPSTRSASSTNRRSAYVSSSPTSGYSSSSSNYLAPSSRSYPRSPAATGTSSSYYKPIRLRERPLLTQISRQLPARAHNYSKPTSTMTRTSHSSPSEPDHQVTADKPSSNEAAAADDDQEQDESNWSSDIGRNISRNKYLIKFREFDRNSPRPSVDVEAIIQLPPVEVGLRDTSHDRDSCVPDRDPSPCWPSEPTPRASLTVEHTMRLAITPEPIPAKLLASQTAIGEKTADGKCDIDEKLPNAETVESKLKEPKKERTRNVKLKLKPIGGGALTGGKKKKSELVGSEATTTTTITDKVKILSESQSVQPKTQDTIKPTIGTQKLTIATPPPPASPEKSQKPVKSTEKKVVKTSLVKAKRDTLEKTVEGDSKENKNVAACCDPVAEPTQPTSVATPKVRKGSKATLVNTDQQTSQVAKTETETEAQKPKTKLIKKKKKTRQEDESGGAPSKTARRRSSAIPKEPLACPQVNEVQVTPATPELSTPPASKQPSRIRFREYNINDFNFLTVLGHGGWGFVILAELKEHDACFAVKCIKKITIVEDDDYESIMIERKVLTLGNIHPFICKLFCTFETPGYLFFVMEYCAGGDLMFHVQHEGKFTESRCRFYAAEIICAIRFLHNRHIIYRDLKLDNILLDSRGHIRLVDFGMCQCRTYREEMLPSNFCGTPEYISPEIIKGVPYNHSVDWWSFGVLLYEMAVGKMPFRGNDENELLWNVCYEQIHYPMFLTKELTTLLKSLLEREPTKRMGMATCKAGDIYDQPFFRSVDWKAVEELRVEPPFVPEVRSNRDVSNFDSDFTESTCELSPVDDSTLARIDQKQFEKFPYTNPDIFIFDPTQQARENANQPRSTAIL